MRSARTRLGIVAILAAGITGPVNAIEPIPEMPGWGGFVVVGGGYAELRSNFVAGNRLVDIGKARFRSIDDRPATDDAFFPLINGEINYTFADGWQAFFGTSLEDAVTLDGVTQLGARKDLGEVGIVQAGFLFSGIPTETWEDPYAELVRRKDTNRDSKGVRLQWDRVLGSAFELTFSYRDISIDKERSGEGVLSVPCDADCQRLLRRDGDQYSFDVSYLFRLGAARNHLLRPRVRYTLDDRDGDAVAADSYLLQLTHVYINPGSTLVTNVAYGQTKRDARNPIFGRKTDSDRFAIDATLFYRLPALAAGWQAVTGVLWGEDDSDVSFHDNKIFMVNVGVMYRFVVR